VTADFSALFAGGVVIDGFHEAVDSRQPFEADSRWTVLVLCEVGIGRRPFTWLWCWRELGEKDFSLATMEAEFGHVAKKSHGVRAFEWLLRRGPRPCSHRTHLPFANFDRLRRKTTSEIPSIGGPHFFFWRCEAMRGKEEAPNVRPGDWRKQKTPGGRAVANLKKTPAKTGLCA